MARPTSSPNCWRARLCAIGCANGALSSRKAIDYAQQIARGLAAAHEKGIVHRDLKPENIFITNDGRAQDPRFRSGKVHASEVRTVPGDAPTQQVATEAGTVMGTVGYMSPEQVRGKPADSRSDIFSFGAILYEMLSGKRAFHGDSSADTMSAILKEDPPDLTETNRNISPALERIVRHCLEKNPAERFQSARDVAFNLEALTDISSSSRGGVRAIPEEEPRCGVGSCRRSRHLLLLASWAAIYVSLVAERPVQPHVSTKSLFATARFGTRALLRMARPSSMALHGRDALRRFSPPVSIAPTRDPSACLQPRFFPSPPRARWRSLCIRWMSLRFCNLALWRGFRWRAARRARCLTKMFLGRLDARWPVAGGDSSEPTAWILSWNFRRAM